MLPVEQSLSAGREVNSRDSDGNTGLMLAICYNKQEVMELLLAHPEVDINARNKAQMTPLHLAVQLGDLALVSRLAQVSSSTSVRLTDMSSWMLQTGSGLLGGSMGEDLSVSLSVCLSCLSVLSVCMYVCQNTRVTTEYKPSRICFTYFLCIFLLLDAIGSHCIQEILCVLVCVCLWLSRASNMNHFIPSVPDHHK